MYNQDKMKKLIYEAYTTDPMNDEPFFDKLKEIMELLQSREDLDKFAEYMDNKIGRASCRERVSSPV